MAHGETRVFATLLLSRETKGAVLYEEPLRKHGDPEYLIGNLYLRKAYLRAQGLHTWPTKIEVNIRCED